MLNENGLLKLSLPKSLGGKVLTEKNNNTDNVSFKLLLTLNKVLRTKAKAAC
jgi:hypothetical protein